MSKTFLAMLASLALTATLVGQFHWLSIYSLLSVRNVTYAMCVEKYLTVKIEISVNV